MTQPTTIGSLEDILSFPFRGKDWQNKALIGSLIVLAGFVVPILPLFLVYGYAVRIARRVIQGDGEPYLPEWDDWGTLFVDGAKMFGVGFIYALPLLVTAFTGQGLLMVGSILPGLIAKLSGGDATMVPIVLSILLSLPGFAIFGVTFLLVLAMAAFLPVVIGHVIATGEFAAAFRVREWWQVFRANVGGFLLALAIMVGLSMAVSILLQALYFTVCLCCLIPILLGPISFYLTVVTNTLYARAYRAGAQSLAAQTE
jgi:hypothetical protein